MTCLCLSRLVITVKVRKTSFCDSIHWSFFPCPSMNNRQPAVFFLTHLEFAATTRAWYPNGAFVHHTLVKCFAKHPHFMQVPLSIPGSAAGLYLYTNPKTSSVQANGHQLVMRTTDELKIRTTSLLNSPLTSCHHPYGSSENSQSPKIADRNYKCAPYLRAHVPSSDRTLPISHKWTFRRGLSGRHKGHISGIVSEKK